MAVKDILPTTNLTWDDIRDSLNASGGSVNNNVSSAFQKSAKINWASKKKPVRLNATFCQDFNSGLANYYPNWWKAQDGYCGIANIERGDDAALIDSYRSGKQWVFKPFAASSASPYRLGDFSGYKKDAKPFLMSTIKKNHTAVANLAGSGEAIFYFEHFTDSDSIDITDLDSTSNPDIANAKVCALMYQYDPLTYNNYPDDVFIGDEIKNNPLPRIVVNANGLSGIKHLVFALAYQTDAYSYMILPFYDDEHYMMCKLSVINDPMFGTTLVPNQIGFEGYSQTTPMEDITHFMNPSESNFKYFKAEEVGSFKASCTIITTNSYTIYYNTQFMFRVNGQIVQTKIRSVNGSAIKYPYVISRKNTPFTIEISSDISDVFYSGQEDGAVELEFLVSRDGTPSNVSVVSQYVIYIDMPPYRE